MNDWTKTAEFESQISSLQGLQFRHPWLCEDAGDASIGLRLCQAGTLTILGFWETQPIYSLLGLVSSISICRSSATPGISWSCCKESNHWNARQTSSALRIECLTVRTGSTSPLYFLRRSENQKLSVTHSSKSLVIQCWTHCSNLMSRLIWLERSFVRSSEEEKWGFDNLRQLLQAIVIENWRSIPYLQQVTPWRAPCSVQRRACFEGHYLGRG